MNCKTKTNATSERVEANTRRNSLELLVQIASVAYVFNREVFHYDFSEDDDFHKQPEHVGTVESPEFGAINISLIFLLFDFCS